MPTDHQNSFHSESLLIKEWNLSRAKQGVFQERTGRKFRKMADNIPLPFPKTQFPKPQMPQQNRKRHVYFTALLGGRLSRTRSVKTLSQKYFLNTGVGGGGGREYSTPITQTQ